MNITEITEMKQLHDKNIDKKKISRISVQNKNLRIIPGLSEYSSLEILECVNTGLTTLEGITNCNKLRILRCCSNRLRAIPDLSSQIEVMDFSNNNIEVFPQFSLENCRELVWSGNSFREIPEHAESFHEKQRKIKIQEFFISGEDFSTNTDILFSVEKSFKNLLKFSVKESKEDICRFLLSSCLSDSVKLILIKDLFSVKIISEEKSLGDLVVCVISEIMNSEHKQELLHILEEETVASVGKCFVGKISRLVSVLDGFSPLVSISLYCAER